MSNERNVYAIDLPGVGLSSRNPFNIKNPEEIIKYYISKINLWREFLGLNKIVLIGHSFGGFISA